jgi:hypothetical protein
LIFGTAFPETLSGATMVTAAKVNLESTDRQTANIYDPEKEKIVEV